MKRIGVMSGLVTAVWLLGGSTISGETALGFNKKETETLSENGYGVSANHPLAVDTGMAVLEYGGNAVDAAVAISYVLGVVEPQGSGIGGGGEMIIYNEQDDKRLVHRYREMAPYSEETKVDDFGIPGFVQGMEDIIELEGSLSHGDLLETAIAYAESGIRLNEDLAERLAGAAYRIDKEAASAFFDDGVPLKEGDLLVQTELAETLKTIRDEGADGFYRGDLTEAITENRNVSVTDFEDYETEQMEPVSGEFEGYTIYSAPPPLAGVTLIQMLQMISESIDEFEDKGDSGRIQLLGEITKQAYEKRLTDIGDPAFEEIAENLTSIEYAREMLEEIDLDHPFKSDNLNDTEAEEEDYAHTTHFVVVDEEGTMVSATNTLTNFFGSGDYVHGFFLNNSLSNFSLNPSSINSYKPGKRARSFTAPTILAKEDEMIGIGSPGGRRIPAALSQVLYHFGVEGLSLQEAVDKPRFYMENANVMIESAFTEETKQRLRDKGYQLIEWQSPHYFGGVQALMWEQLEDGEIRIEGAADKRRSGSWDAASFVPS